MTDARPRRLSGALLCALAVTLASGACDVLPFGSSTPTVIQDGHARLDRSQTYDLDSATVDPGAAAGADLWYQWGDFGGHVELRLSQAPSNTRTFLSVMSSQAPGYDGCSSASLTNSHVRMASLQSGQYLCAKTDVGRIVEIRMTKVPAASNLGGDDAMAYDYRTWAKQ